MIYLNLRRTASLKSDAVRLSFFPVLFCNVLAPWYCYPNFIRVGLAWNTLIKSAKLRGVRRQGMTKQYGRPHIMRNDAASATPAASRRARHVRNAPNPQGFPLIPTMES